MRRALNVHKETMTSLRASAGTEMDAPYCFRNILKWWHALTGSLSLGDNKE